MAIKLARGDDALAVLRDPRLCAGWRDLAGACPWATGCQSVAFVDAWYDVYGQRFEPVVVQETDADGSLVGLLTLARERASSRLIVAGDHQAEYQAWLARPGDGDGFAVRALSMLRERFPKASLRFRYLPPGTPIDWARTDPLFAGLTQLRSHRRPLVRWTDEDGGDASLAKKSNKSRLNRLKRTGEVAVRELEDVDALERVIDDIAAFYDLRQGAMNNSVPFHEDPQKRRFHLELMRAGVLHAVVLTAGRSMAAAILSVRSAGFLSVGVFAYSPFLARHSPGKFLVLMLGKKLAEQGYRYLDLTPGGAWKDRFATASDEVYEAVIEFDRMRAFRTNVVSFASHAAKSALGGLGITPAAVKATFARMFPAKSRNEVAQNGGGVSRRLYYLDLAHAPAPPAPTGFARDDLSALFAFRPVLPWTRLDQFLSAALDRFSEGEHLYTKVEGGRLIHCIWMAERSGSSEAGGNGPPIQYPHRCVVISDPFTHPSARGREHDKFALVQCLADAARMPGVRRAYVAAAEAETSLRAACEALGFISEEVPSVEHAPESASPYATAPVTPVISPLDAPPRPKAKAREKVGTEA